MCDVEHFPYTTCRYCRGGACVPGGCHVPTTSVHVSAAVLWCAGCLRDLNCPQDYECVNGICRQVSGFWCGHCLETVFKSTNKGLCPYYIISDNKQGSFQMITEDYNKGPRVVRKDYVLWKIQNMQ